MVALMRPEAGWQRWICRKLKLLVEESSILVLGGLLTLLIRVKMYLVLTPFINVLVWSV